MYKPSGSSDLPERRPRPIIVSLPLESALWYHGVFVECQPPVRVDEQGRSPLQISLVHPKVVIEPVVR